MIDHSISFIHAHSSSLIIILFLFSFFFFFFFFASIISIYYLTLITPHSLLLLLLLFIFITFIIFFSSRSTTTTTNTDLFFPLPSPNRPKHTPTFCTSHTSYVYTARPTDDVTNHVLRKAGISGSLFRLETCWTRPCHHPKTGRRSSGDCGGTLSIAETNARKFAPPPAGLKCGMDAPAYNYPGMWNKPLFAPALGLCARRRYALLAGALWGSYGLAPEKKRVPEHRPIRTK